MAFVEVVLLLGGNMAAVFIDRNARYAEDDGRSDLARTPPRRRSPNVPAGSISSEYLVDLPPGTRDRTDDDVSRAGRRALVWPPGAQTTGVPTQ